MLFSAVAVSMTSPSGSPDPSSDWLTLFEGSSRRFHGLAVAQHMLVAGVVECRVAKILGAQHRAHEYQRGTGQLGLAHLPGDRRKRPLDDHLVVPGDAVG